MLFQVPELGMIRFYLFKHPVPPDFTGIRLNCCYRRFMCQVDVSTYNNLVALFERFTGDSVLGGVFKPGIDVIPNGFAVDGRENHLLTRAKDNGSFWNYPLPACRTKCAYTHVHPLHQPGVIIHVGFNVHHPVFVYPRVNFRHAPAHFQPGQREGNDFHVIADIDKPELVFQHGKLHFQAACVDNVAKHAAWLRKHVRSGEQVGDDPADGRGKGGAFQVVLRHVELRSRRVEPAFHAG